MTILRELKSLADRRWRRAALVAMCGLALAIGHRPPAEAQEERVYARGLDTSQPEDLTFLPLAPITRGFLPEAVDLSPRFPPPGDQGKIGSCVSWAMAYAARSYYELAQQVGPTSQAESIASPAYLHAILMRATRGATCVDPITNLRKAVTVLQQQGVASVADYPITSADMFCRPVTPVSRRFLVRNFQRAADNEAMHRRGRPSGISRASLDRMRQLLAEGHPIVIGMMVGRNFNRVSSDQIITRSVYGATGAMEESAGGHAMVLTGYDDGRHAFRVLNSWGRTWADGGYSWVDYNVVLTDTMDAIVLTTDRPPPRPQPTPPGGTAPADAPPLRCGAVTATGSKLSGFVATLDDLKTVNAYARGKHFEADVTLQPWPVCEALLTLNVPLKIPDGPKVALVGGDRPLKVGEAYAISVTPPRVPSYLYVVYIEDDGTVVNLSPRRGPIRRQTDGAAAPLLFGDGREGRPTFRVTPLKSTEVDGRPRAREERGHEAVIVVAARAPIAELEAAEGADSPFYRAAPKAGATAGVAPDRLFLSALRDISLQRAAPDTLPREVMAAVLHLKIAD